MKLMPLALALLMPIGAAAQTPPVIRDIASGSQFTLVVKADGTVVGWGRDPDGQAARPVSANRVIPAPITIDLPGKALQVATGDTTQYALLEDGTVVEAKGDEEIVYDGETHSAANLFDALKEGYYGKL